MAARKIEAPKSRTYEIGSRTLDRISGLALDRLVADIQAAARLNIPFTVQTTHRQAFRNGGNVVKGDIYEYRIEFGTLTEIE